MPIRSKNLREKDEDYSRYSNEKRKSFTQGNESQKDHITQRSQNFNQAIVDEEMEIQLSKGSSRNFSRDHHSDFHRFEEEKYPPMKKNHEIPTENFAYERPPVQNYEEQQSNYEEPMVS